MTTSNSKLLLNFIDLRYEYGLLTGAFVVDVACRATIIQLIGYRSATACRVIPESAVSQRGRQQTIQRLN
jgi:hypothetical protein